MVGQQQALAVQVLDGLEKALEDRRVIQIGSGISQLPIHLGQRGAAQPVSPLAQVDQQQPGFAGIAAQLRRQGPADVGHGSEGGDNQGQGRAHHDIAALQLPDRLHRQGILADRYGDSQRGTEFQTDAPHRLEQPGILVGTAGGGHPVGGQLDIAQGGDAGGGEIGQRLADGHAARGRRIDEGNRGTFSHRHSLAGVGMESGRRHADIRHRHLPGTHHLVPRHQTTNGAIADVNEETLVGHRWAAQHAPGRLAQLDAIQLDWRESGIFPPALATHFRRLAEQQGHGDIDRVIAKQAVRQNQLLLGRGLADDGIGTTLPLAKGAELVQSLRFEGEDIAFLGFVAPDLHRRHARFVAKHLAEFEAAAAPGIMDDFRHRIGQAAGADIMDGQYRRGVAKRIAAVDDFLAAALHFRVVALHRGEIQILGAFPGCDRRGRAASQSDQHRRTAQHHDGGPGRHGVLAQLRGPDVAHAAGEHDRLVVAAESATGRLRLFEGPEIPADIGPTELVVESRAAKRAGNHDVQRGGNATRLAVILFPGLLEAGDAQIRNREAGQPGLGMRATPRCSLVADFAAGTGRGAGKWRNGGGMIVGFHLHQQMGGLVVVAVFQRGRIAQEYAGIGTLDHGGIVAVG